MPKLGNQVDFVLQERTGSIYIHFRQLLLKKNHFANLKQLIFLEKIQKYPFSPLIWALNVFLTNAE